MFFSRRAHRFTAWLACFAILMMTFAPVVSHAVSHAITAKPPAVGFLATICSTSGGDAWVVVGDQQQLPSPGGSPDGSHFQHCPFCSSQSGVMGLPPIAAADVLLPLGRDIQPPLFTQSPRPLPIWAAAQSRAPPSL